MEPAADPASTVRLGSGRWIDRAVVPACLALVAWLVQPGLTQPDTKSDLTISPWRYLGRSIEAWNAHTGVGELQNQAYGYLFPIGPLFGIGDSLGMPAWAVQRLWWTVLLLTAYFGVERVVRRLDLGGPMAASIAGLAFALSARVMTVLPHISVQVWPAAVAPWLLLVAIRQEEQVGRWREQMRAAAATGLLAATLGGVNATVSLFALCVPALYLVTGRRPWRTLPWWVAGTVLGSAWWIGPLLVLGRYAYPFLDFIETARATTSVTTTFNSLRGTSQWVAFLTDSTHSPVWAGGWVLARSTVGIVATAAVAALGAMGVIRLRGHLARFALLSILSGVLFMVLGRSGDAGSPVAGQVQSLLDGVLAPLRNVHKADPLIRLPLALGLAIVTSGLARLPYPRLYRGLLVTGVTGVLFVSFTPLWNGTLGSPAAYQAVPTPWQQVARETDRLAADRHGSTLLLPNARAAQYTWGSLTDEPLSALATSPVLYRAAAPLGPPGATRVMDRIDRMGADGAAQPHLADGLARLGVQRIVVRRNLHPAQQAVPWQAVERTLARSANIRFERVFGTGQDALTLWSVMLPAPSAQVWPVGSTVTVAGAPEDTFRLADTGLLKPDQTMRIEPRTRPDVVTDTLRWRTYNAGVPTQFALSSTLTADDKRPLKVGQKDLPPAGTASDQPYRRWIGLKQLTASSSAGDPLSRVYLGPGYGPAAAIDGDPTTSWLTGDHGSVGRLELSLARSQRLTSVTVRPTQGAYFTTPVRVRVDAGGVTRTVRTTLGQPARLRLPAVTTDRLTITITAPLWVPAPIMGIAELDVAGVDLGSTLHLPQPIDPRTQSVLLSRDEAGPISNPDSGDDAPVLRRQLTFTTAGRVRPEVWVRADGLPPAQTLGCGGAGTLELNGQKVPLSLTASKIEPSGAAQLQRATPCTKTVRVAAGQADLTVRPGKGVRASVVTLAPDRSADTAPSSNRPTRALTVRADDQWVVGAGGASVLSLPRGYNAGWVATTASGMRLRPVEVEGWKQGFLLPEGGQETVRVEFAPRSANRWALVTGAVLVGLLALLWLMSLRWTRVEMDPVRSARHAHRPAGRRRLRTFVGAGSACAVATISCGLPGVVVVVVACSVPRRWWPQAVATSLAGGGVVMAAVAAAGQPEPANVIGQLCGALVLALLARRLGEGDEPNAGSAAPRKLRTTEPAPLTD